MAKLTNETTMKHNKTQTKCTILGMFLSKQVTLAYPKRHYKYNLDPLFLSVISKGNQTNINGGRHDALQVEAE